MKWRCFGCRFRERNSAEALITFRKWARFTGIAGLSETDRGGTQVPDDPVIASLNGTSSSGWSSMRGKSKRPARTRWN